jgi:hypothetical protein
MLDMQGRWRLNQGNGCYSLHRRLTSQAYVKYREQRAGLFHVEGRRRSRPHRRFQEFVQNFNGEFWVFSLEIFLSPDCGVCPIALAEVTKGGPK